MTVSENTAQIRSLDDDAEATAQMLEALAAKVRDGSVSTMPARRH